jgi:acylphosphatase
MKMVRAHLIIGGTVQGVYFRSTAVEVAQKHGVCGWVKNTPEGTVEVVLEGGEEDVKKVIEWCHTGPPMAIVKNVDVEWDSFKDEFDDFSAITRYTTY